jgi:hypothetical protein
MSQLTFTNLVVGKIYSTVEQRLTKKAMYLQPTPDENLNNIGTLKPNESFVLLEKSKKDGYFATKILTSKGSIGWTGELHVNSNYETIMFNRVTEK